MTPKKEPRRVRAVVEEVKDQEVTEAKFESVEEKAKETIAEFQELKDQVLVTPPAQVESTVEVPKRQTGNAEGVSVKLIVLVAVLTAVVVAIVSGGVYVYYTGITSQVQEELDIIETESTPKPTQTPSPTPKVSLEDIDVEDYKISILNGSGKIGVATEAKTLIEKEDFKVVDTGNADRFYRYEEPRQG